MPYILLTNHYCHLNGHPGGRQYVATRAQRGQAGGEHLQLNLQSRAESFGEADQLWLNMTFILYEDLPITTVLLLYYHE